mmetsp:Transcript_113765/g.208034  ORF Transcript_113765/g.208034 Transcript_113765/m.208034 type:complete len:442 (-) Transcript_113765:33-1358(-)
MNPQDSEQLEKDTTSPAEQSTLLEDQQSLRDWRVQCSAAFIIVGVVWGTYCYLNLTAAFEADTSLQWTKHSTSAMATIATMCETLGLVFIGPFSDSVDQKLLLTVNVWVVFAGMLFLSFCRNIAQIMLAVSSMALVKGILWPCIGALVANNVSPPAQDHTFLIASIGSRIGDILASVSLSWLLLRVALDWRHAVTVELVCIMFIVAAGYAISPTSIAEPKDRAPSIGAQFSKAGRLLVDLDGWLAFFTLVGTYFAWALQSYLVVLLSDIFNLDPGAAAGYSACFPVGCVLGLACGAINSALLGQNFGRLMHVVQACVGVVAMVVLSLGSLSLMTTVILLGTAGFGFVVPAYAPYLIYAAHCVPTDRAFRLAVLDGVASLFSVALTFSYGSMRASSETPVAWKLYGATAMGLIIATVAMAVLYWRLRNSQRSLDDDAFVHTA